MSKVTITTLAASVALLLGAVVSPGGTAAAHAGQSAVRDVARHEQPVGTNRLLSVRPNGTVPKAYRDSTQAAASHTGRFVAFVSEVDRLASTRCPHQFFHVYVRDRREAVTHRVDALPDGTCGDRSVDPDAPVSISGDGRLVAFTSRARNLAPGGGRDELDVFVRDMITGTIEIISLAADGGPADSHSFQPDISADGSTVVFTSYATNLIPDEPPGYSPSRIFRHDLATGTTTLVSTMPPGERVDDDSRYPSVDADGGLIVYETLATNIVDGGYPDGSDIVLFRTASQSSTLISRPATGDVPDGASMNAQISADGSTIAYASAATNLVADDTNGFGDVFVLARKAGTTQLISRSFTGGPADELSDVPVLSADGRQVAFASYATNLVPGGDDKPWLDVFLRDLDAGVTTLVSRTAAGDPADDHSGRSAISGDGSLVAFESTANDLVDDTPDLPQALSRVYAYRVR